MTLLQRLLFYPLLGVFTLAWLGAVASFFLGLAEGIGLFLLDPRAYRVGPVGSETVAPGPRPAALSTPAVAETKSVKYRILDDGSCVFRRGVRPLELRWNTPLPLKGELTWRDGAVRVVGRYPLGAVSFYAAWTVGWTAGGAMMLVGGMASGLPFLVLGWAFVAALGAHSRDLEKRRFEELARELREALGA